MVWEEGDGDLSEDEERIEHKSGEARTYWLSSIHSSMFNLPTIYRAHHLPMAGSHGCGLQEAWKTNGSFWCQWWWWQWQRKKRQACQKEGYVYNGRQLHSHVHFGFRYHMHAVHHPPRRSSRSSTLSRIVCWAVPPSYLIWLPNWKLKLKAKIATVQKANVSRGPLLSLEWWLLNSMILMAYHSRPHPQIPYQNSQGPWQAWKRRSMFSASSLSPARWSNWMCRSSRTRMFLSPGRGSFLKALVHIQFPCLADVSANVRLVMFLIGFFNS